MKNHVQPGNTVTLAAPYDVEAGDGLKVEDIFGVANTKAASGEAVEVSLVGVFDLAKKASQAWDAGEKVYWNETGKHVTKTAQGGMLIGVALEAVGGTAGETIGRVRLNGSFG